MMAQQIYHEYIKLQCNGLTPIARCRQVAALELLVDDVISSLSKRSAALFKLHMA